MVVRFGIAPSETAAMTLDLLNEFLATDSKEVITLADTAALHRFMMNG